MVLFRRRSGCIRSTAVRKDRRVSSTCSTEQLQIAGTTAGSHYLRPLTAPLAAPLMTSPTVRRRPRARSSTARVPSVTAGHNFRPWQRRAGSRLGGRRQSTAVSAGRGLVELVSLLAAPYKNHRCPLPTRGGPHRGEPELEERMVTAIRPT